ncbi:MAG: hypothetical protein LBP43_02520 [Treponema sp.]|jgi:hypothetical protein|nr:hypothetical protein [Treponema sp.]
MNFRPSVVLSAFCSLGLGLFLLVLVRLFLPALSTEGYGVLSLDAAYGDREIGALLSRGGVENYISESTQWVFLDDFEKLRRIPLDLYGEYVESFDPRNDGYAEKLRSFFVRGGERFFFIPLSPDLSGGDPGGLKARIARSLGDIPYTFSIIGTAQPVFWFLVFFVIASAGTLILSGTPLLCTALLPVLAPLFLAGPLGFALSAVLMGLSALLREPVRDYLILRRYQYRRFVPGPAGRHFFRDWLGIFRRQGILSPVFILVYGIICGMGGIPLVLGLFFFCSFFWVFFLFIRAGLSRGETPEHIRFIPVSILDVSVKREFSPGTVFPFALASLFSFFLFPLVSGSPGPAYPDAGAFSLVSPAEYEEHIRFQISFSVTPLGNRGRADYTRYIRDEDGLVRAVSGDTRGISLEAEGGIPPFPLENLMAFLGNAATAGSSAGSTSDTGSTGGNTGGKKYSPPRDIFPVCLVLLTGIPVLFSFRQGNRKKKRILVYQDKRIAA